MAECFPKSQLVKLPVGRRHSKMSGVDTNKHHDRFSNASILSILTRSYNRSAPVSDNEKHRSTTSTASTSYTHSNSSNNSNTSSCRVSPIPQGTRSQPVIFGKDKENDREYTKDTIKAPTVLSRFSITSSAITQGSVKELRISKGPGSNIYQIGAEIGRGGHAVVYQAFNVETGDFVAVKRIPLAAIDDEALSMIQGETELMKRLNHPHIVEYYDTIRSDGHLNIILEYIENGSLAGVLKKFGNFTEKLVILYVTQILKGLKYLHEQGVIHRDIKGANILTTKDGVVKLADFGVALRQSDAGKSSKTLHKNQDVAGSPYWIAPEIIEMSIPTTACDIWSVGCTVIELMTGKPPYFNQPPMAALFSIVQDDCPPIPAGISDDAKHFLHLCFERDAAVRSTAQTLLEHSWLVPKERRKCSIQTESSSIGESKSMRESSVRKISVRERREGALAGTNIGGAVVIRSISAKMDVDRKDGREGGKEGSGVLDGDHRSYRRRSTEPSVISFPIVERKLDPQKEMERQRSIVVELELENSREHQRDLTRELEREKEKEKEKGERRDFNSVDGKVKNEEREKGPLKHENLFPYLKISSFIPPISKKDLSEKLSDRLSKKPSSDSYSDASRHSSSESLFEQSIDGGETGVYSS